MGYQLVLQWPTSFLRGYDLLIALEDAVIAGIGDLVTVDGHDMGSGEMNIFVFTYQPDRAFERIKSISKAARNLRKLRAGYRKLDGDEYTPNYPEARKISLLNES